MHVLKISSTYGKDWTLWLKLVHGQKLLNFKLTMCGTCIFWTRNSNLKSVSNIKQLEISRNFNWIRDNRIWDLNLTLSVYLRSTTFRRNLSFVPIFLSTIVATKTAQKQCYLKKFFQNMWLTIINLMEIQFKSFFSTLYVND